MIVIRTHDSRPFEEAYFVSKSAHGTSGARRICCGRRTASSSAVSAAAAPAGGTGYRHSPPTETSASPGSGTLPRTDNLLDGTCRSAAGHRPGTVILLGVLCGAERSACCICCRGQPPKKCPELHAGTAHRRLHKLSAALLMRSKLPVDRTARRVYNKACLCSIRLRGAVLYRRSLSPGKRFPVRRAGTTASAQAAAADPGRGVRHDGVGNHSPRRPPACLALSRGHAPRQSIHTERGSCRSCTLRDGAGDRFPPPRCTDWHRKGLCFAVSGKGFSRTAPPAGCRCCRCLRRFGVFSRHRRIKLPGARLRTWLPAAPTIRAAC